MQVTTIAKVYADVYAGQAEKFWEIYLFALFQSDVKDTDLKLGGNYYSHSMKNGSGGKACPALSKVQKYLEGVFLGKQQPLCTI